MGMFDRPAPSAPLSPEQQLRQIGGELADTTAPFLKKQFGYESQERELRGLAAATDLSNGKAVQDTYNAMLLKNPDAANKWITSVMPTLKANIEQQKLEASKGTTSGTPENQAKAQRRAELIKKYGSTEGNTKFSAEMQKGKEDVQAAGVAQTLGANLYKTASKNRFDTKTNLNNVKTSINTFKQAKAGSPAAGVLAENIITSVFGSSARAQTEIARIASAGGFIENIGDWLNDFTSGVKTAEHYDSFLKVLEIYKAEQEAGYNNQTDYLQEISNSYGLEVPKSTFDKLGKTKRKWNPTTGTID